VWTVIARRCSEPDQVEAAERVVDLLHRAAVVTGGAVVPPALVGRVEVEFGAPVSIVFAQTEASPVITMRRP
jgi:acyl-CoA synthetase (AMP-forming)/AMP-acid ligase II